MGYSSPMAIYSGKRVRIKDAAWKRVFGEKPNVGPQVITEMPSNPPFHDKVLLAYPFHWWDEDDLED